MAQDQVTTGTGASEFGSATEAISCSSNSSEVGASVTGEDSAPSSSEYFSPRIERITQLRRELSSDVEVDIESSKEDWTELSSVSDVEDDDVAESNRIYFELLCEDFSKSFSKIYDYQLGRKIAEGQRQAETYEATIHCGYRQSDINRTINGEDSHVLKVLKKVPSLLDLQRQRPLGMMPHVSQLRHWLRAIKRSEETVAARQKMERIHRCCEILASEFGSATEAISGSSNSSEVGASVTGEDSAPSSSEYFSPRIMETMTQLTCELSSDVEVDIESSKEDWTHLSSVSVVEDEDVAESNSMYLLGRGYPVFFSRRYDLQLGRKIAEGGQAEIYEATNNYPYRWQIDINGRISGPDDSHVLKVFKKGSSLLDLQRQWPLRMMSHFSRVIDGTPIRVAGLWMKRIPGCCEISAGVLVGDGRFAFSMRRYWGDLRKLIDMKMEHNGNQGPPFKPYIMVKDTMIAIAKGMQSLHDLDIVHRDLKASNVLINFPFPVSNHELKDKDYFFDVFVADFECSVGVVGTGFWRAPEILRGIRDRDVKPSLFTKEADVYSYAITCYEILTGCTPFEGLGRSDFDVVIDGKRPNLPRACNPGIKALLTTCWDPDPQERPTFEDIITWLEGEC